MKPKPSKWPVYDPKSGMNVFHWILRHAEAVREAEKKRLAPAPLIHLRKI